MKIFVISTVNYGANGIAIVIKNLYCSSAFENDNVVLFAQKNSDKNWLNDFISKTNSVIVSTMPRNNIVRYFNELKRNIENAKPDIVHVHGNSHTIVIELLAAKLGGCKVRIVHSHNSYCKHHFVHRLLTPVFNMLCNFRIACSSLSGQWMYGNDTFITINNGIDTTRYIYNEKSRITIRNEIGVKESEVLLGHVGSFVPAKNHEFLLKLMRILPEKYKLILIGDGALFDTIKQKVKFLHLDERVVFVGATRTVEKYLSAIDMIVMPSLYEGLPLALIEEQTNGLRCIVSDNISGEVDKTGQIVFLSLSNVKIWKEAILNNDCDRTKHTSIKETKKIIKSHYDIECEGKKLREIYQNFK